MSIQAPRIAPHSDAPTKRTLVVGASLPGANLRSFFVGASLCGAMLRSFFVGASLRGAIPSTSLVGASLCGAIPPTSLVGASLCGAIAFAHGAIPTSPGNHESNYRDKILGSTT